MCGILGSINFPATSNYLDDIKHRGPDAAGANTFFINNHVVDLLHRRLSIIDLSEAGNQPMLSTDAKGCIIFNGEIYNHALLREKLPETSFRGHSDTESILNLFINNDVKKVLPELNGIFGIAYLDIEDQKLYLARDRFGVKPLYYYFGEDKLIFSSEIRPIKSIIQAEIDAGTLLNSMRMRYTPSPLTIYKEIAKVEPGQLIRIDLSQIRLNIHKEYFVKKIDKIGSVIGDYQKIIQTYGDLFEKAVERQLMADVDIGILLSGGVDSALVGAIAKHKSKSSIKAFTVGFNSDSEVDEIAYARQTAETLGLEHHTIKIGFSDFLESIRKIVSIVEEPIGTTSIIPMYYLSQLAAKHVKVVLSGQGADEPLGGYFKYRSLSFIEKVREFRPFYKLLLNTRSDFFRNEHLKRLVNSLQAANQMDAYIEFNAISSIADISKILNPPIRQHGVRELHAKQAIMHKVWSKRIPKQSTIKDLFLFKDLRTSLADDLLMYTDKISMNYGLECRVPILDNELIEYVESLHSKYKYNAWDGKLIHKAFAKEYLPASIINRKKRAFQSPTKHWFKEQQREIAAIFSKGGDFNTLFDATAIQNLLHEHASKLNQEKQIFLLLSIFYLLESSNSNELDKQLQELDSALA